MTVLSAECDDDEECISFWECPYAKALPKNRRFRELKHCGIYAESVNNIIEASLDPTLMKPNFVWGGHSVISSFLT